MIGIEVYGIGFTTLIHIASFGNLMAQPCWWFPRGANHLRPASWAPPSGAKDPVFWLHFQIVSKIVGGLLSWLLTSHSAGLLLVPSFFPKEISHSNVRRCKMRPVQPPPKPKPRPPRPPRPWVQDDRDIGSWDDWDLFSLWHDCSDVTVPRQSVEIYSA